MNALYVNQGSELSQYKVQFEQTGFEVYRSRMACGCTVGSNRRNGILIIDSKNTVFLKVMRCKACAKVQEGGNAW